MRSSEASKTSALQFYKIDASSETGGLLERIREILVEGDSHNASSFSEKSWAWQYKNLPSGKAHIYTCVCDDKIVGYYHVPIYRGRVNNQSKNFAMVQDVAVSASMRGRSVFRKLAEFATADLIDSEINLIYTFPNEKSIHTFLKYNGYEQIYTYDSYVLPVRGALVFESKLNLFGLEKIAGHLADKYFDFRIGQRLKGFTIERKNKFDEQVESLFQRFNERFSCHLERTTDYLQWRFFEKPVGQHFLITLEKDGEVFAAAVFKLDEILDAKTAVVLEFAFAEEIYLAELFRQVRKNDETVFGEKIGLIFTACCCDKFLQDKSCGFIKIPPRFNPRPLNLLVRNITENRETVLDAKNWLALLSDWDVL